MQDSPFGSACLYYQHCTTTIHKPSSFLCFSVCFGVKFMKQSFLQFLELPCSINVTQMLTNQLQTTAHRLTCVIYLCQRWRHCSLVNNLSDSEESVTFESHPSQRSPPPSPGQPGRAFSCSSFLNQSQATLMHVSHWEASSLGDVRKCCVGVWTLDQGAREGKHRWDTILGRGLHNKGNLCYWIAAFYRVFWVCYPGVNTMDQFLEQVRERLGEREAFIIGKIVHVKSTAENQGGVWSYRKKGDNIHKCAVWD